jgi:hypothetical protein
MLSILRVASHYGCPSQEVVELKGQTLLRVQRNGLKIDSQLNIGIGAFSARHSVKPPKAKPKVHTFGAPHFIPYPKQPFQSNVQDLVKS